MSVSLFASWYLSYGAITYPSGDASIRSSELIVGVDVESSRPALPVGRGVATTASTTSSKSFGHEVLSLINGSEEIPVLIARRRSTKDE